jgi:hypothetical protein
LGLIDHQHCYGPLRDSSFKPSCSWTAVKIDGPGGASGGAFSGNQDEVDVIKAVEARLVESLAQETREQGRELVGRHLIGNDAAGDLGVDSARSTVLRRRELGAVLADGKGKVGDFALLAVEDELEALGEEGLEHEEKLVERGIGRGFGEDVEANFSVANPIGSGELGVVGDGVGVAETVGESAVGRSNFTVTGGAEVGGVEVAGGLDGFEGGDVEGRGLGDEGQKKPRNRGLSMAIVLNSECSQQDISKCPS